MEEGRERERDVKKKWDKEFKREREIKKGGPDGREEVGERERKREREREALRKKDKIYRIFFGAKWLEMFDL
jgi:hypothetical protein